MIVAAGLGTRLRPLTAWRPKAALPVRGVPLIGITLELLARAGVREVVVNLHHLPERLRAAAEASCPDGLALHFSHEPRLLHTGGAIRRVADFLRESDPCVVVGGDMVVDVDLAGLVARHRASGRDVTLLLKSDRRAPAFGTIGVDGEGRVSRIARRFDRGGECGAGIYTWVNVFSAAALRTLPAREVFNHLVDWIVPRLRDGDTRIGAELLGPGEGVWEPVGTPQEYLAVNLRPLRLSYLDVDARGRACGARLEPGLVVGPGAEIGAGARLEDVVVWDGERVPAGFRGRGGVFAHGAFHPCGPEEGEAR